jgi:hypothetical protein
MKRIAVGGSRQLLKMEANSEAEAKEKRKAFSSSRL